MTGPFRIEPGRTVRIEGERGTYRVKGFDTHGAVHVWGGTPGRERMRTVHPDRIKPPNRGDLAPGNANDYRNKKANHQ